MNQIIQIETSSENSSIEWNIKTNSTKKLNKSNIPNYLNSNKTSCLIKPSKIIHFQTKKFICQELITSKVSNDLLLICGSESGKIYIWMVFFIIKLLEIYW